LILGTYDKPKRGLGLRKSMSRGALKDITNYNSSSKKKKKLRPNSAKTQARKSRPGSGKKDTSFRSQNRSKSKDKSKQRMKDNSENHRVDGNLLLKSLKNTHKPSSMSQLLGVIDKPDKMKIRPPKVPKHPRMKIDDHLMMNIENINMQNSRSRQIKTLDRKSSTIEQAVSSPPQLEFKRSSLKRKSSFANIKRDSACMNFNLGGRSKDLKARTMLKNISYQMIRTQSDFLTKDAGKKSLLESFHKDKPEIEYVVSLHP
jgi:hypothetical protein